MIERKEYLEKLRKWKDKDLIKVVSGITGCGKSTLFKLFIDYLTKEKIKEDHIIFINLEDPTCNFKNYLELYNHINDKIKDKKNYYVFIDEVQNVEKWEKAVDGLYIKDNVDIYITGSNAYFLSGELATLLSGRYIEIKMLPLSFKEYVDYYKKEADEKLYLQYTNKSSFPYTLNLDNQDEIDEYLESLFSTIIIKDIATRKNITDITLLKKITAFMFSNIGSILSINNIVNTLNSDGTKVSFHTVESYLEALTDSMLFNKVSRFDTKGKQYLKTGEKYYATDVTMRYAILGRKNIDVGHILENIVYLELIRRGYKVYIGKNEEKEIDFVAENKDGFTYFQVAYSTTKEETLERELSALQTINDHYPKYLLTMDIEPVSDFNGIKKLNVLDWLVNK